MAKICRLTMDSICLQLLIGISLVMPLKSRSFVWKDCGCYKSLNSNGGLHAQCLGIGENLDWDCLELHELNSLDISHNNLTEIPAVLFSSRFSNLTDLNVSYNNITKIPDTVTLRFDRLNIAHNQISELPAMPNNTTTTLKDFNVTYNNLTSLRSLLSEIADHIESEGNPLKCECNNNTLINLIYARLGNGQLKGVMCTENCTSKFQSITNVPTCQRQINEEYNEPNIPWDITILVSAVLLLFYITLSYNAIEGEKLCCLMIVDWLLFLVGFGFYVTNRMYL
ncbi:probable serine/threonine-protein kinase DDB_G0278509 [Drosophila willistoni]|uniref:probable serine/threonine-protein kinase DDB_G0278509 n=1 Tax=Drosophila willistoni TaxID=7260 RepID=UPI000C26C698|nr:probable serine/threonine-protein kinase DDB_G0278509 [Drosophila willistoni]